MKNTNEIKHIDDLTDELISVFLRLKSNTIKPSEAKEMHNNAGKIINAQKVKIEYCNSLGIKAKYDFLYPRENEILNKSDKT